MNTSAATPDGRALPIGGAKVAPFNPDSLDNETLLSTKQVCARYGNITTMTLWRWMHSEAVNFPRPRVISRHNYWPLGDLRAWDSAHATRQQRAA